MTTRVLFLCTGNSARSIMAEAILRHAAGDRFEIHSAGADPAGMVSPFALAALERRGVRTDRLTSKSWEIYAGADAPAFDHVISLCRRAAEEVFPQWERGGERVHWPVTDPLLVEGNHARMQASFDEIGDVIAAYVDRFLKG
ncbi:MAG: arsenate reductase ArsC [Caulobacterales bacterium]|nr:arsenate reductase ArsC [Caulobacterales bacterium]